MRTYLYQPQQDRLPRRCCPHLRLLRRQLRRQPSWVRTQGVEPQAALI